MSYRDFRDKVLRCCDCDHSFVWTAGEQSFYFSKGLADVKRCPACRELRKRTINPYREARHEYPG